MSERVSVFVWFVYWWILNRYMNDLLLNENGFFSFFVFNFIFVFVLFFSIGSSVIFHRSSSVWFACVWFCALFHSFLFCVSVALFDRSIIIITKTTLCVSIFTSIITHTRADEYTNASHTPRLNTLEIVRRQTGGWQWNTRSRCLGFVLFILGGIKWRALVTVTHKEYRDVLGKLLSRRFCVFRRLSKIATNLLRSEEGA